MPFGYPSFSVSWDEGAGPSRIGGSPGTVCGIVAPLCHAVALVADAAATRTMANLLRWERERTPARTVTDAAAAAVSLRGAS